MSANALVIFKPKENAIILYRMLRPILQMKTKTKSKDSSSTYLNLIRQYFGWKSRCNS